MANLNWPIVIVAKTKGSNQLLLFFCFFRFFEEVFTIFGFEHLTLKVVDRAEMLALGQGISETKNIMLIQFEF